MTVVTFTDFIPSERYDGFPWTKVRIDEAVGENGPWTEIDLLDLNPVDADPTNPAMRSFTTDEATLENGWYRLTFLDASNDFEQPTQPLYNAPDDAVGYSPSIREVARKILARTVDSYGNHLGTFSNNTTPTYRQVKDLIEDSSQHIESRYGSDVDPEHWEALADIIALRTAMQVEVSYYAEQIDSGRSPYDELKQMYDGALERMDEVLIPEGEIPGVAQTHALYTLYKGDGTDPEVGMKIW